MFHLNGFTLCSRSIGNFSTQTLPQAQLNYVPMNPFLLARTLRAKLDVVFTRPWALQPLWWSLLRSIQNTLLFSKRLIFNLVSLSSTRKFYRSFGTFFKPTIFFLCFFFPSFFLLSTSLNFFFQPGGKTKACNLISGFVHCRSDHFFSSDFRLRCFSSPMEFDLTDFI